jgi:hypothetical protein
VASGALQDRQCAVNAALQCLQKDISGWEGGRVIVSSLDNFFGDDQWCFNAKGTAGSDEFVDLSEGQVGGEGQLRR